MPSNKRVTYVCATCDGPVTNHHSTDKVERFVGPKQEEIKPFVRGLGHWHCTRCGCGVKVKRSKA